MTAQNPIPHQPKVTVVIPTHNRQHFIVRSLDSVLSQDYPAMEVLVVDDYSTDSTREIVRSYERADSRVGLISLTSNQGAQVARNQGIKESSIDSTLIAFLDSDDEWLPGRLQKSVAALNTGAKVVYGNGIIEYQEGKPKSRDIGMSDFSANPFYQLLTHPPGPVFPTLLVEKAALEAIGYLDEDIPAFQEWDTTLRLAKHNRFTFVDDPVFIWHRHSSGTISGNPQRNADGYAKVVDKHKKDILDYAGSHNLAAHYVKLAQLNRDMGRFLEQAKYMFSALYYGGTHESVVNHVQAVLQGKSPQPLNPNIKVYG